MTQLALVFDGPDYNPIWDEKRLQTQLGKVYLLMRDGKWRTHQEISQQTGILSYNSIAARLGDLRKKRFGGYEVKRRRQGDPNMGLFEYQLRTPLQSRSQSDTIIQ